MKEVSHGTNLLNVKNDYRVSLTAAPKYLEGQTAEVLCHFFQLSAAGFEKNDIRYMATKVQVKALKAFPFSSQRGG